MLRSTQALVLFALLAASCAGGQTGDEGVLSSSGKPHPTPGKSAGGGNWVPCSTDMECSGRLEQFAHTIAEPVMAHRTLVGGQCLPERENCGDHAFCACVYEQESVEQGRQPFVFGLGVNPACDLYSRDGTCLLWSKDFDGCEVDDATACNAACAHAIEVWASDDARSLDVQARSARCVQTACQNVLEVEGMCYPAGVDGPVYDCALDDDEILARAYPDGGVEVLAQCSGQGCKEDKPLGGLACAIGTCDTKFMSPTQPCKASGGGADAGSIPDPR